MSDEDPNGLPMRPRDLRPGQRTEVWLADVDHRQERLLFQTDHLLLEAPNWSSDGTSLLLNGAGHLWRLRVDEPTIVHVSFVGLPPINNDHVLDADRGRIYLSANDGHIYMAPMDGGRAERVTWDDTRFHFLHGVNPDGTELAFVELPRNDLGVPGRLALLSISDGSIRYPAVGTTHLDGPEYSPDGEWIYVNTEEFGVVPGHAQIARIPCGGGVLQQLVDSPSVDWFPHLSPDGARATYISFPPGTVGHPADLEVEIHVVETDHWQHSMHRIPFRGGQGSMNVNSWAPDSARFAYVTYPESKL